MKSARIALLLAALGFTVAACERTPTGGAAPAAARHDGEPVAPPPPDTTGRGGGIKGSGG